MIEVPVIVLEEAQSWIDYQCTCTGNAGERSHLMELIEVALKGNKQNSHIRTTVDKIERIRDWIELESHVRYGNAPIVLKKLNGLLSEYERIQDLNNSEGIIGTIKYFLKWGFRGL